MTSPRPKQSVAQDLLDDLLRLIQRHFYPDAHRPATNTAEARAFAQDRSRLLSWVILWPARFMNAKGFTLPGDRYKQIFTSIILEALRHGNTSKVSYRPAWLKMVIQSHFRHHWEEYYQEAKSTHAQADHALHVLGKIPRSATPSPVPDLAAAHALLARKPAPKKPRKEPSKELQLNL